MHVIKGEHLLVPGQLLAAPFPNHIVLDTNSGQARWETSSREWISEDLFSKFPPVRICEPMRMSASRLDTREPAQF